MTGVKLWDDLGQKVYKINFLEDSWINIIRKKIIINTYRLKDFYNLIVSISLVQSSWVEPSPKSVLKGNDFFVIFMTNCLISQM